MRLATRLCFAAILASAAAAASAQNCVPDATHLCFEGGRFSATATFQSGGGSVAAAAVQPEGGLPGYFRFADPAAEILPRVVNGCTINNRMWVFGLPVSNAGWQLTVTDHVFGGQQVYSTPPGQYSAPIFDLNAFPCAALLEEKAGGEVLGSSTMDLFGGRFRVSASLPGFTGEAHQLNRNSGFFSYFSSATQEVLVKIFYPADSGFFGVAASWNEADTTVEVEDLCTLETRVYHTGTVSTIFAPQAFSADDADCGLWANGFESGNTSAWNSTVP